MFFRQIAEANLAQYAYLIGCQRTGEAVVIDPMRDIDRYEKIAEENGLQITVAAETHIHADFLSGTREFAAKGVAVFLSDEGDNNWKYLWDSHGDYDVVKVTDGDRFSVGNIDIQVVHTPGHTPEHICFLITDRGGGSDKPMGMVTGDFVFVGDLGRPDLLETAAGVAGSQVPSARTLYQTILAFGEFDDYMAIWPGHGAGSACGKALGAVPQSTVGYERMFNSAWLAAEKGEEAFVENILDGQPEPPMYFARMKRLNKQGAPVLGGVPKPPQLNARQLESLRQQEDVVVVDTRQDRSGFMHRHIPGSLYVRANASFPTNAGSFIDGDARVVLLVDSPDVVDTLVRNLIRIGIDTVIGFGVVDQIINSVETASIGEVSIASLGEQSGACVLDVRRSTEFEEGHIPGAVNKAHTRLASRVEELPTDQPIYVHCRSGGRAASTAAYLKREGFDVTFVSGSVLEWLENREVEA